MEQGWSRCKKCEGMWYSASNVSGYSPDYFPGYCFAKGGHSKVDSGSYSIPYGAAGAGQQGGWKLCSKCKTLVRYIDTNAMGNCARDGLHTPDPSSKAYNTPYTENTMIGEARWAWCIKCKGLFYVGGSINEQSGVCNGGTAHENTTLVDYRLPKT